MIFIDPKFNLKLEEKDGIYSIFTNERIIIQPFSSQSIFLPYKLKKQDKSFVVFNLSKSLLVNNLQIIWSNLNEESAVNGMEFLIKNASFDKEMLFGYKNTPINHLIGSVQKIDILPGSFFGDIRFIKTF